VQPGDHVPAGKLLIQLDDVQPRARVASAESGVKSAQAALEAATHNGTLQERQGPLRSRAQPVGARSGPPRPGCSHQAQRRRRSLRQRSHRSQTASGISRRQPARRPAEFNQPLLTGRSRPRQGSPRRCRSRPHRGKGGSGAISYYAPISGTVYSLDARPSDFVEQGKLLLQMADLDHERVRAYFDEPDIGKLAVGQSILIKWDAARIRYGTGILFVPPPR